MLWGGRFSKETDQSVQKFTSSIEVDSRLWREDIDLSVAHARMLGKTGILSFADVTAIEKGLVEIKAEIELGHWWFSPEAEDVHGEIEKRLFEKIGVAAKKIHTARSRNDQITSDLRLYLARSILGLQADLKCLQQELVTQASLHIETLLPGMTHLQHAQPISLAQHLLAYFWMLDRDQDRLTDSLKRIKKLPLGSAALAGTSFPIDRSYTLTETEFESLTENSLDAVSDRDYVIEFLSSASLIHMHLSRFAEELIIWSSFEFKFVELGDDVTTGSSIMPQKKNPDVAELIRGKTGRTYGNLMAALTLMKGLPLSYNRDMQEDKELLFDSLDTIVSSVKLTTLMLQKAKWNKEAMKASLKKDFSNATDLADELAAKGVPFREAHEIVGHLVQDCISKNMGIEDMTLPELQHFSKNFDSQTLDKVKHLNVMKARQSLGGTAPAQVLRQIGLAKQKI